MNIRIMICEALEPLGHPVFFHAWQGAGNGDQPPDTYITFQEMLSQEELGADDVPWIDGHYIALSIWSSRPTEELAAQVRSALMDAGFRRQSERDLYEEDTKTFHRSMDWWIYEEVR